jgi:hypothetical protein
MLQMLPSWMKMRNDPENSTGAKFIDAFGVQISEIEKLLVDILVSHHPQMNPISVGGVNISNIDIIYKVYIPVEQIGRLETVAYGADSTTLGVNQIQRTSTIYEFYKRSNEDVYYYDANSSVLYLSKELIPLYVNGAYMPEIMEHHVWGPYDEMGLLVGCPRISGEKNIEYRKRLLNAFVKTDITYKDGKEIVSIVKGPDGKPISTMGNSTRQGLLNYISRSLNINQEDVIINELSDEFVNSLINPDGTIKPELKEYIKLSNRINLSDTNTYWDTLEENRMGMSYLPLVWDTPLDKWDNKKIQNGIGDIDDLEIIGPQQEDPVQSFNYHIGVEGLKITPNIIYPQHEFKYKVVANGLKEGTEFKPEQYKYTVLASELIPLDFKVKANRHYNSHVQTKLDGHVRYHTDDNRPIADTTRSIVSSTDVRDTDFKKDSYITNNIIIVPGSKIMNPDYRYIEVMAALSTKDRKVTPVVDSIRIEYTTTGNVHRTLLIDTRDTTTQDGETITTGFEENTWDDVGPIIKLKNDTNDNYNVLTTVDGTMTLAKGDYQKIYDSEGDWDDGEQINVRVSPTGTLKLSI